MCSILGVPLHTLNVHGGMEDKDIVDWMNSKIQVAEDLMSSSANRIVLFLDEINTCNCMGLFKEIVCDRTMNGVPLLDNIKIIAACNPYRLRNTKSMYGGEEMAGLVFEHFSGGAGKASSAENVGTGIKDPLRNLVYRVHPLPESMIDHIFDFGSLSPETEKIYIRSMLKEQLGMYYTPNELPARQRPAAVAAQGRAMDGRRSTPDAFISGFYAPEVFIDPFDEFVDVFTELVCSAQECIRLIAEGERSVASLRDVARCIKIFIFFGQHFSKNIGKYRKLSE